jgi:hypothetical protein
MAKSSSTLTTRQFERREMNLSAELIIAPEHRTQVKFSAMSNAADQHVVRGRATDVSPGGVGFTCRQFLPRMTEATLRIFDSKPVGTARDGTPIHEVIFEQRVKVKRAYMTSHEPTYSLGTAFIDSPPDIDDRIAAIFARTGAAADGGVADA